MQKSASSQNLNQSLQAHLRRILEAGPHPSAKKEALPPPPLEIHFKAEFRALGWDPLIVDAPTQSWSHRITRIRDVSPHVSLTQTRAVPGIQKRLSDFGSDQPLDQHHFWSKTKHLPESPRLIMQNITVILQCKSLFIHCAQKALKRSPGPNISKPDDAPSRVNFTKPKRTTSLLTAIDCHFLCRSRFKSGKFNLWRNEQPILGVNARSFQCGRSTEVPEPAVVSDATTQVVSHSSVTLQKESFTQTNTGRCRVTDRSNGSP